MMPSAPPRRRHLAEPLAAVFALLLTLASVPASARAASDPDFVSDDRVTVRLVSEYTSIEPGRPIQAGLSFELADHWHVYWRNPGDSGEPPRVRWYLPEGFDAGEPEWPTPQRIEVGPITNFGYEREVLLPVRITTPTDAVVGQEAQIAADVSWLVCRAEECIPGQARLALALPVQNVEPSKDSRCAPAFARARASIPSQRKAFFAQNDRGATLTVPDFPPLGTDPRVEFFPFDSGVVADFAGEAAYSEDGGLRLQLGRGDLVSGAIGSVEGVVVVGRRGDSNEAAFAVRASAAAPPTTATNDVAAPPSSLGLIVAFAFLGGLLLNLMPCVFPVLSLKVLAFVEQAHHDPRRVRMHGWAFAAGVIVSFWSLAVTLLALRAGGQQLGWGFQLQSPAFLVVLCVLLFVLALSLSGVVEVGLWMTTLGGVGDRSRGYTGSFATGALATVVATPCTAPFMGPALGFALTQTASVSLLVFTALGAGMAAPYVALAHFPAALSRLPKPGAWMETVRQFTAFPLYATVLWLLYVFSRQTSADATWRLMTGLLLLAGATWGWGVVQRSGKRGWLRLSPIACTAVCGLLLGLSAARLPADSSKHDVRTTGDFWGSWSPERVTELQAQGRPVFVNFTADWCLSCQVNERTVFSTTAVRELFAAYEVEALKADWTNKDDRIAAALARFGRDGVPLYVFYPGSGGAQPQILPQLPTHGALREAFSAASQRVELMPTSRQHRRDRT